MYREIVKDPAVGDNLLSGTDILVCDRPRVLKHLGFVGGAAVVDGEIEVFAGSVQIANMRNPDAGDAMMKQFLFPVPGRVRIPAGIPLTVECTALGAGSYTLAIDLQEV